MGEKAQEIQEIGVTVKQKRVETGLAPVRIRLQYMKRTRLGGIGHHFADKASPVPIYIEAAFVNTSSTWVRIWWVSAKP